MSRCLSPPRTKGPFVPGRVKSRDKRSRTIKSSPLLPSIQYSASSSISAAARSSPHRPRSLARRQRAAPAPARLVVDLCCRLLPSADALLRPRPAGAASQAPCSGPGPISGISFFFYSFTLLTIIQVVLDECMLLCIAGNITCITLSMFRSWAQSIILYLVPIDIISIVLVFRQLMFRMLLCNDGNITCI